MNLILPMHHTCSCRRSYILTNISLIRLTEFFVSSINPHHRSLLFQILRQHWSDVISNRWSFFLSFPVLFFFFLFRYFSSFFFGSPNPNVVLISNDGYEFRLSILFFFGKNLLRDSNSKPHVDKVRMSCDAEKNLSLWK